MEEKIRLAVFGQKRLSREGGIEIVVKELCTRMAQNGCEVTCYNRAGHHVSGAEYDKTIEYDGIRQKVVPTIEKKGLAAVSSSFFAALCSAFGRYDVVHIHAEGPAFFCWIPKLFGKRVVNTIHGLDWDREKWRGSVASKFIRGGEKNAVKYADEIIVLSKDVQKYFLETYGRETHFIPNGVNRPEVREAKLITDHFGLEKDSYILFLGRLVPEKGIRYLVEAFKNVKTDKKLVIAGGSKTAFYYVDKEALVKFNGFLAPKAEGSYLILNEGGYQIEGQTDTWKVIDEKNVQEQRFVQLVCEQTKKQRPDIILHDSGVLVAQTIYGFDSSVMKKIEKFLREQKPELLHYQKFLENGTAERAKESGTEQNYNMIDGCVNNNPKKPRIIGNRISVLDRLHIKLEERKQKSQPQQQQQQERSRKN